jgi:hypothetical protein
MERWLPAFRAFTMECLAASKKARLHRIGMAALFAALTFSATACLPFVDVSTRVDGRFATDGPELGSQQLQPSQCLSGDPRYFLGVDLVDSTQDRTIRLVFDPVHGSLVRVMGAGPGAGEARFSVVFDRDACSDFVAEVRDTGWRIDRVRDFSGRLKLDCRIPSGDELRGSATFEHCH